MNSHSVKIYQWQCGLSLSALNFMQTFKNASFSYMLRTVRSQWVSNLEDRKIKPAKLTSLNLMYILTVHRR